MDVPPAGEDHSDGTLVSRVLVGRERGEGRGWRQGQWAGLWVGPSHRRRIGRGLRDTKEDGEAG